MNELVQLAFNGIVVGAIIALGAGGASLVWGVLRIGNFAHGDYMTMGAFAAWVVNVPLGANLVVAALAAALAVALFAVLAHWLILRPMRGRGMTTLFIITVGLSYVMRNTLYWVFGVTSYTFSIDQSQVFLVGPIRVSPGQVITILMAVVAIGLLGWLLSSTSIGRSMRAMAENRDLAAVTGVDIDRLETQTWLLAGGLAGLGGVGLGLVQGVFDPGAGVSMLFPIFAAIVLGGIGSDYGAILGGLALGLAMEISTWSGFAGGLPPTYKIVFAFVVLIGLLLVRPQGILGKARVI